ncbi:MAG: hypothetical protein RL748_636 [Pseudomonadota bacterium]|jgi:hypothetical protein
MKPLTLALPAVFVLLGACAPPTPDPVVPMTRFQKLAIDGTRLALQAGPWQCLADHSTGLVWEVKQANEGPQFAASSYSWFDGRQGSAKGGSCGKDEAGMPFMAYQSCDTQDLLNHLNQRKLCGFDDWRLPSAKELRTILIPHRYPGETHVPFPLLPHVTFGPYWTADVRAAQSPDGNALPQVWSIHVGTMEAGWLSSQRVAYAMAVRGPQAR